MHTKTLHKSYLPPNTTNQKAAAWRKPCTRLPSSKSIHPIPNGEATSLPNGSVHRELPSNCWEVACGRSGKSGFFPWIFHGVLFVYMSMFYYKHTYMVNTWVFKENPAKLEWNPGHPYFMKLPKWAAGSSWRSNSTKRGWWGWWEWHPSHRVPSEEGRDF